MYIYIYIYIYMYILILSKSVDGKMCFVFHAWAFDDVIISE